MDTELSCFAVADYFIATANAAGDTITNLKLQKVVYYAQAWHLALHHIPLFSDCFEAWVHGPVCRRLYQEYRGYGWRPIERDDLGEGSLAAFRSKWGRDVSDFLKEVACEYMTMGAYELECLVHSEEPWKRARGSLPQDAPSDEIIKNEWMRVFYGTYVIEEEKENQ